MRIEREIEREEATIVIQVDWHKEGTDYTVYKRADLCEFRGDDMKDPGIYIKKKENPGLEILVRFRANRCIEALCFREGDSTVEPSQHSKGPCGPGFELTEKIDPFPKNNWWHAIVRNDAEDPQEGFALTLWLETEIGKMRIDPRVYNHGHIGDRGRGIFRSLLSRLRRLFGLPPG